MRNSVVIFLALLIAPSLAHAGSQVFYSSGTFTVPHYSSLTVYVYGGGGGSSGMAPSCPPDQKGCSGQYSPGSSGGTSVFGWVQAYGGGAGGNFYYPSLPAYTPPTHGAHGGGTGGSVYTGSGASGGAGICYKGVLCSGNGGNGGLVVASFSPGQLTPGGGVSVTVGSGGAGGYGANSGGNGYVSISWSDPPAATCSIALSPGAVNRGNSSYLYWSTSNANHWFYISNVGYVGSSGATYVAPSSSTTYSGTAYGSGGYGYCGATLTVYQPCSLPWGGSISHGQSTTAYQSSSVAYGGTCTSQTRSCSNGTLSGSYQYQSCSVSPPTYCTLDGVTVNHGSSQTFYSSQVAPTGQACSSVSQSRSCTNGTLSGSSSFQFASCSCAPVYYCSGDTIMYRNTSCATSTVLACGAPASCVAGQSTCEYPDIGYGEFENGEGGDETGELRAAPQLVPMGGFTKLYWNVENAQSCTITGSNGDSWSTAASGEDGQTSSPITEQTTYTLSCEGYEGSEPESVSGTAIVNVAPIFQEF